MGDTEERFGAKGFNGSWKLVKAGEELEPQRPRAQPCKMQNRSRNTASSTASCRPTDYLSQVEQQMLARLGNCSCLTSAQLRGPGSQNSGCFLQIQYSSHLKIKISALVECSSWAQTQRYWNFLEGGAVSYIILYFFNF